MKKTPYKKAKIRRSRIAMVKMRTPSRDSYNELKEQLIATFPGCGHSCTSDIRLKKNIKGMLSMLSTIQKLRPVSFQWNAGEKVDITELGLIAQEVEKLLPEAVSSNSQGVKQIAYHQITAVLLRAMQELILEVEELKQKIK